MTCQTDTRAFERMLRENGFSRSRAKAITAKGFKAADMDMDETQEVADLIDTLKASQLRLEEKRGGRDLPNNSASLVLEAIKKVYGAYRSVRMDPQPMYLELGRPKKFKLGVKGLGNRRVSISMPSGGFYHFKCKIRYWQWNSSRGPMIDTVNLYFDGKRGNLNGVMSPGRVEDAKQWMQSIIEKSDYEKLLSQLEDVLREPLPLSTITYTKRTPAMPRGMNERAQPFKITVS